MLRTMFAIGIAGLIFAGGFVTTQAAPILPMPTAATVAIDNMTDVQWGRRCWRDRWGRLRCGPGWGPGWRPGWGGGWVASGPGWAPGGVLGALTGAAAGVATAGVTRGAGCVEGGDCQRT